MNKAEAKNKYIIRTLPESFLNLKKICVTRLAKIQRSNISKMCRKGGS